MRTGNGSRTFAVDFTGTRFLETSATKSQADRLNWRCEMLLARHPEAIRGKRILDLASHDGRFSFACLKLGARHVTGVEARAHLVRHATETFGGLGYGDRATFVQADVFDSWRTFERGAFDTILCLGFLYHTIRQVEFFQEARRLDPEFLILDTQVRRAPYARLLSVLEALRLGRIIPSRWRKKAFLEFKREDHRVESNTVNETGVVAVPTEALIELLFENFGFDSTRIDWTGRGIDDWSHLEDYQRGNRASYIGRSSRVARA